MDQALKEMRWLGFDWDEGPDIGGPFSPYTQSQRKELYLSALQHLIDQNLVYPCICSRRDVETAQSAPHAGEMLHYPGTCRGRFASFSAAQQAANGRIPAWRFSVADSDSVSFCDLFAGFFQQNVASYCGDFVLAREEFGASYMLAVVVDDSAMGVTHVIRGDDLLPATPAQLLIYKALNLTPPQFCHIPLVVGPDGKRLAKRHGDTRISTFRTQGISPEEIIGFLAASCGFVPPKTKISLHELIPLFDLSKIPHHPSRVPLSPSPR